MKEHQILTAIAGMARELNQRNDGRFIHLTYNGGTISVTVVNGPFNIIEELTFAEGLPHAYHEKYGKMTGEEFASQVNILAGLCTDKCMVCEEEIMISPKVKFTQAKAENFICSDCYRSDHEWCEECFTYYHKSQGCECPAPEEPFTLPEAKDTLSNFIPEQSPKAYAI